jgi:hypothetical protein
MISGLSTKRAYVKNAVLNEPRPNSRFAQTIFPISAFSEDQQVEIREGHSSIKGFVSMHPISNHY